MGLQLTPCGAGVRRCGALGSDAPVGAARVGWGRACGFRSALPGAGPLHNPQPCRTVCPEREWGAKQMLQHQEGEAMWLGGGKALGCTGGMQSRGDTPKTCSKGMDRWRGWGRWIEEAASLKSKRGGGGLVVGGGRGQNCWVLSPALGGEWGRRGKPGLLGSLSGFDSLLCNPAAVTQPASVWERGGGGHCDTAQSPVPPLCYSTRGRVGDGLGAPLRKVLPVGLYVGHAAPC